jgi:hypothetical protein
LAPIQGLLEILAKIPGVGKLLGPAVEKMQEFRNNLKGTETENTIVQNVVPGKIEPVPETITQTGIPPRIIRPINNNDRNNQTVTRAAPVARRLNRQTVPPQIKTVTPP